jgi:hypothetical protein
MLTWPNNLLDASYGSTLLNAVTSGNYELEWYPLTIEGNGHTIEVLFSARPLRVEGVFVNVSATLQQQIADALGAMLPTPKLMDLAWLSRPATIQPYTMPIAATSAAMLTASSAVDTRIASAGSPAGILPLQKTWCIGNSLSQHPGKAMNYGFFCIPTQGTSYNGIGTEACVSFPLEPQKGRVIQGQGWAHDPSHLDYSQWCPLVHRSCRVDSTDSDLATVLQDASLAPLLSHEGPLKVLRQPGVALFACQMKQPQLRFAPQDVTSDQLCPTPPRPSNIASVGPNWGLVAMSGAAALGVVGLFWLALKYAGKP